MNNRELLEYLSISLGKEIKLDKNRDDTIFLDSDISIKNFYTLFNEYGCEDEYIGLLLRLIFNKYKNRETEVMRDICNTTKKWYEYTKHDYFLKYKENLKECLIEYDDIKNKIKLGKLSSIIHINNQRYLVFNEVSKIDGTIYADLAYGSKRINHVGAIIFNTKSDIEVCCINNREDQKNLKKRLVKYDYDICIGLGHIIDDLT